MGPSSLNLLKSSRREDFQILTLGDMSFWHYVGWTIPTLMRLWGCDGSYANFDSTDSEAALLLLFPCFPPKFWCFHIEKKYSEFQYSQLHFACFPPKFWCFDIEKQNSDFQNSQLIQKLCCSCCFPVFLQSFYVLILLFPCFSPTLESFDVLKLRNRTLIYKTHNWFRSCATPAVFFLFSFHIGKLLFIFSLSAPQVFEIFTHPTQQGHNSRSKSLQHDQCNLRNSEQLMQCT